MKDKELRNYLFGNLQLPQWSTGGGKISDIWKFINNLNYSVGTLVEDVRKLRDIVDPITKCSNCGTNLRKSEHNHEE